MVVHIEFSRVENAAERTLSELSTDLTGSALEERYCEAVFRGLNMAVARLHHRHKEEYILLCLWASIQHRFERSIFPRSVTSAYHS